ncbi:MAG: hypothetical protein IPK91_14450 [Saprospiraceae bacterium]|nr:hypothetical protein [Saprospiraceae bacterium]MBK8298448.1 hypothetical protein [Saprospiraceae bacterium]
MEQKLKYSELGNKIYEGLKIALLKLKEDKKRNHGILVVSENGKIVLLKP